MVRSTGMLTSVEGFSLKGSLPDESVSAKAIAGPLNDEQFLENALLKPFQRLAGFFGLRFRTVHRFRRALAISIQHIGKDRRAGNSLKIAKMFSL